MDTHRFRAFIKSSKGLHVQMQHAVGSGECQASKWIPTPELLMRLRQCFITFEVSGAYIYRCNLHVQRQKRVGECQASKWIPTPALFVRGVVSGVTGAGVSCRKGEGGDSQVDDQIDG